jgi:hypothetical protein
MTAEILATTQGINAVSGAEEIVIEWADGERQVHEGAYAEARDLAARAGLHVVDYGLDATTWRRRTA